MRARTGLDAPDSRCSQPKASTSCFKKTTFRKFCKNGMFRTLGLDDLEFFLVLLCFWRSLHTIESRPLLQILFQGRFGRVLLFWVDLKSDRKL